MMQSSVVNVSIGEPNRSSHAADSAMAYGRRIVPPHRA